MHYLLDTDWIIDSLAERRNTPPLIKEHGNLIPDFDILIAATAVEHDLTLLTFNQRHSARIPGLRLFQQD